MQQLRVEGLTSVYGEKTLFKDISFLINENDRIGLIGVNGSGKTSLLNVIADLNSADQGQIIKPNDYRVSYLKQQPELDESLTVMEAAFAGSQPVFQTIRNYEAALSAYSANPDDTKLLARYTKAEDAMNQEDAWLAEAEVKTILTQLHVPDLNQVVGKLSGGQKKRVGLAQVLIQKPDLLILDEPTNHLDFDSIAWLEKYLANYKGAVLTVTHDRYFLDQVATRIFELSFGEIYEYQGNYADFVAQKAERVAAAVVADHKQEQLYKKELAWMKTSARARSTKQTARQNAFAEIEANRNTLQIDQDVEVNLGQQRLGKKVITVENANLAFGDKVILHDFNYLIQAQQRIGITGANGAGKSTFLNALAQRVPLDSGVIEIGETVKLAFYTQQMEPIPDDKRMIAYLSEVAETIKDNNGNDVSVTELLEQFLFPRFMHGTLIRKLSGGEKRRLYLLKLLMSRPNVLFLDEPTNDLDIGTLTVLEDYLASFQGTVITVSHDRYFLDKVADKLLIFDGNGEIEQYTGLFSSYLETQLAQAHPVTKHVTKAEKHMAKVDAAVPAKKKMTYKEKQEWATIENDIEKLENQQAEIETQMEANGADFTKLSELQRQLETVSTQLETMMDRWEYLSELAN
ncbi:ABC-F family ATP-binding cassette domain-containing protein [Periweissella fabalis]|uniref:ABC-F family ATP-binding cassette domain-containing protein n=1 Tax=Periweissella fabalis TaxID=1070421 RepID=A0A7X6MZY9_9LACO|nr:ABC-F family ATP-binding cassette domain-containing protein [Periweissella fabalis]MCM0598956.1 ABC-F family ATP-binding cassette domain-containing protein [Periweissella fabalis]NKZ23236.1 ABC-F family ATP-binding cassette domain-containing protein [Periweissella fabalis]